MSNIAQLLKPKRMKKFIVQAKCNTSKEFLDYDDQQELELICEPFKVECETEDEALDAYHSTIPIACLDYFDIDVLIEEPDREPEPEEPPVDDSLDECYTCGKTWPSDQLDHRKICPECQSKGE